MGEHPAADDARRNNIQVTVNARAPMFLPAAFTADRHGRTHLDYKMRVWARSDVDDSRPVHQQADCNFSTLHLKLLDG